MSRLLRVSRFLSYVGRMTASSAPTIPQWTLGDRLRKARESAGMEQGELASRIGISRNTVGNYELNRGQRPPKVVILRAWAYECRVPYEWLVDGFRPGVVAETERARHDSNVQPSDPWVACSLRRYMKPLGHPITPQRRRSDRRNVIYLDVYRRNAA